MPMLIYVSVMEMAQTNSDHVGERIGLIILNKIKTTY